MKFTARDLIFSAINGLIIGGLTPFVFVNLGHTLPISHVVFAAAITICSVAGVFIGYLLSKWHAFFFQLAKFGLVGVTNTVIDFGIFNLLIWVTGIPDGNAILGFKFISVPAAIVNSYIWNKFWSFDKPSLDEESARKEFSQFLGVSFLGLIFNATIVYILINVIGSPHVFNVKQWDNIANAFASVAVLLWNFIGYKFFVFKR